MDTLPICKALSKQSGQRCKNFSSKGKAVCRIHGGRSTGAKTAKGKHAQKTASLKHGMYSKEAIAEARQMRELFTASKQLIAGMSDHTNTQRLHESVVGSLKTPS